MASEYRQNMGIEGGAGGGGGWGKQQISQITPAASAPAFDKIKKLFKASTLWLEALEAKAGGATSEARWVCMCGVYTCL